MPFRRFNHTPGLGPDDSVFVNILLCRISSKTVFLHPFKSFVSSFNGCFAVLIAPEGLCFLIVGLLFGMLLFAIWMRISVNFSIGSTVLQKLSVQSSKAAWM